MDCSDHRWVQSGFEDHCKICDGLLERLEAPAPPVEPGPAAYLGRVPDFLAFAVSRPVLVSLAFLAPLIAAVAWGTRNSAFIPASAMLGTIIMRGLEASMYFRMVTAGAYGQDPFEPPDIQDFQDDIVAPAIRYLFAALPLLISLVWLGIEMSSIKEAMSLDTASEPLGLLDHPGPLVAILVSLALLPLLTLVAAVSASVFDILNPARWIEFLRVTGATYAVGSLLFYVIFAVELFVFVPALAAFQQWLSIPIITSVLVTFLSYLPMAVRARALGGLVEPYFQELG